MIVRHFIQWVRTASANERAGATRALVRAYLFSDMPSEDRQAAEDALLMMLDDPSPMVREAMAQTLARSAHAPGGTSDEPVEPVDAADVRRHRRSRGVRRR